jgi:hypothetical protein
MDHTCDDVWMRTTKQNGQWVDVYRCNKCSRTRTEAASDDED